MKRLNESKILAKLFLAGEELLDAPFDAESRRYNRKAFLQLMKLYAYIKHRQLKKAYNLVYSVMETNVRDEIPSDVVDYIDNFVRN